MPKGVVLGILRKRHTHIVVVNTVHVRGQGRVILFTFFTCFGFTKSYSDDGVLEDAGLPDVLQTATGATPPSCGHFHDHVEHVEMEVEFWATKLRDVAVVDNRTATSSINVDSHDVRVEVAMGLFTDELVNNLEDGERSCQYNETRICRGMYVMTIAERESAKACKL